MRVIRNYWIAGLESVAKTAKTGDGVFDALRMLRKKISDREKIPPYMIFSDANLRDMAERMPKNENEMLAVAGVGEYKLRKYGREFLAKIGELRES